jgi:hypothetical protein
MECLSAKDRDEDAETWSAPIFSGFEAARMEIDRHWQQLQEKEIEASDSVPSKFTHIKGITFQ